MSLLRDPITPWLVARGVPARVAQLLIATLIGLSVVGLVAAWGRLSTPWENDAYGFWRAWKDGELYDAPWLDIYAYVYAPILAQIAYPLTLLSWPAFSMVWNAAHLMALTVLVGPVWAAGLIWLLPWPRLPDYDNAVLATLENGNPMIFLALFVAAAYRWPAFWSLAILMKVTPGVGLVWFVVRREWRNLGIAIGATAALTAISFVFAPQLWFDWFDLLIGAARSDTLDREIIPVPLAVRGLMSIALIAWGARTDRYWTVPLGVMWSLPAIALGGYAVGVAALAFTRFALVPTYWVRRSAADAEPVAA